MNTPATLPSTHLLQTPLDLSLTAQATSLQPEKFQATLMVGDSSNDAAAARAAGCPVVLMRYGYNHGQPVDGVAAQGHFDSLADAVAWLAGSGDNGLIQEV